MATDDDERKTAEQADAVREQGDASLDEERQEEEAAEEEDISGDVPIIL